MFMHTATDVAKWFLAHNRIAAAEEGAEFISNLKLQKLLYYAQGCALAVTDEPLFGDEIVAWQHGPVVECVYHAYKNNGSNGIVFEDDFDFSQFTPEENELLEEVYDTFGQYSAWKLRNMTHEETPWLTTQQSEVISTGVIKDYFKQEYLA
ncbi:MAG: SocA family protein [Oscillospiraceae bacterium]|nr:SocA family protein [Oscillospiraceae bacterium]